MNLEITNNSICFFSNMITSRLQYTAELVFQDLLGLCLVFTQDKKAYLESPLPKINYSEGPLSTKLSSELFIKNQTLLFENQIFNSRIEGDFSHFKQPSALDFDVLAAVFLLVTRYEEYLVDTVSLDTHNRFSAKMSMAYKYNFLQKPIVNQWIIEINERLNRLFPELKTSLPTYQFQPSFDIDMPWKYKHKGFLRTMGGFAKDIVTGHFGEVSNRLKILRGVKTDPDFTFDYILQLHKTAQRQPIFFFLLGDHAEFDKNPDVRNKAFQKLIHSLASAYRVGLHPSYRSNESLAILQKEKARFENLTQQSLQLSRQHFLKLRFPETYQRLLVLGVKHDYSLGYADDIGFRASIATPFRWFDLSKNEVTDLWIHPFQAMDVTLKDYLKLSPDEAVERVKQLIEETRAVGGTFTTLWHNSSFSNTEGWQNWREVYEKIKDKSEK